MTTPRGRLQQYLAWLAKPAGQGPVLGVPRAWLRSLVTGAVLAVGIALRLHALPEPPRLTWDEHHFVENARNYLAHRPDWNDHPPLGKLLIAVGMQTFGDNSLGWRAVPFLFGVLLLPLVGALARSMFPRVPHAGALAASFLALDGFFIAFSRTALLDGIVAALYLLGLFSICKCDKPWHAALAYVAIAAAASIKWTGITLVLPLLWVIAERRLWAALWLTPLTPLTYVALYALGLHISGEPWSVAAVLAKNVALLKHHLVLTDMTNPATSEWYTWLVLYKPIVLRRTDLPDGSLAIMTTVGNPVLWWSSSLVMLAVPGLYLWARRDPRRAAFFRDLARPAGFAFVAWAAPILPWVISDRDSYYYHYLPAYAVALLALAAFVGWAGQHRPRLVVAYLAVALAVSAFFAPVWSELPVSRRGWRWHTWLRTWR